MSTTQDLVAALKAELKAANITYADLADKLEMSESSIKRVFAKADMPLSRIDDVLRASCLTLLRRPGATLPGGVRPARALYYSAPGRRDSGFRRTPRRRRGATPRYDTQGARRTPRRPDPPSPPRRR